MSTYAVFGMTRPKAWEMAKKRVKNVRKVNGINVQIPESEWLGLVEQRTEEIMASDHCIQLSDKFDSHQFAREFAALARRIPSRDLRIKAQCDTGKAQGKRKLKWVGVDPHTGRPLESV